MLEFLRQGGLNSLVKLLICQKWQIVAVTLETLRLLFDSCVTKETIEFMKQNSHIYSKMWEKIADNNKNVRMLAI